MNTLYYGDNLDVLRQHVPTESVDLIYLDPPFNSNRSYNVLFKSHSGEESDAQIEAFDDTWHWGQHTDAQYAAIVAGGAPIKVSEAIEAMHKLLGPNDMLAYLVMMTARLVEMHRVLKRTGSLYLHCDPTASHYLKVILDAIFGPEHFRNEVVWKRAQTVKGNFGQGAKAWPPNTDSLLFYTKSNDYTFNPQFTGYTEEYVRKHFRFEDSRGRYRLISMIGPGGAAKGNPSYEFMGVTRFWRYSKEKMQSLVEEDMIVQTKPGTVPNRKLYLAEGKGVPVQSLWTDIGSLQAADAERLGYPTQKPLALLERIIEGSSNEGDVVLDPFCGCGTAVDAAQKLHRRWMGIDITYLAIDLIRKRMRHGFGDQIESTYEVHGIPTDVQGAEALFNENPFDFERWAVSLVDGQPNEKQVGDKGVDGRIRFWADKDKIGMAVVSVKGGSQVNPAMVQSLVGAMRQAKADMAVFIGMRSPTAGMREVADKSGLYTHPITGNTYPKVQIITIAELLAGKRPAMPTVILPYIQAVPKPDSVAVPLF